MVERDDSGFFPVNHPGINPIDPPVITAGRGGKRVRTIMVDT